MLFDPSVVFQVAFSYNSGILEIAALWYQLSEGRGDDDVMKSQCSHRTARTFVRVADC